MAPRTKTTGPGPDLPVRFFQPPGGAPCAIMTADTFAELFRLAQKAALEAPVSKAREDVGLAAIRKFLLNEDAVRDVNAYLTDRVYTFDFGPTFGPDAEDAADVAAFDATKALDEETFPLEIATRLTAGDNPLKVFREYRGLTQEALAEEAGLSTGYVSQMETGFRPGSVKSLGRLAIILGIETGDLLS